MCYPIGVIRKQQIDAKLVLTSVTLIFDLWPWPFAWTSFLSSVLLLKIPRWYNNSNIANGKKCARERVNGLIRSKSFNWLVNQSYKTTSFLNEVGRELVPRYTPTKLGRDPRRIAPVRVLTDLSDHNNLISSLSTHLMNYISYERNRLRCCPKVHTVLPCWTTIREELHPRER